MRPNHPIYQLLGALVLLAAMIVARTASEAVASERIESTVREIFVPFDDLHVLLESQPERVFLSRREYESLLKRAKRPVSESAPHKALLIASDYTAQVQDDRALVSGTLAFDVLEEGVHALPLPFSGVGIRSAKLDDQPAPLGRRSDGSVQLFLQGVGQHVLELQIVTQLQTAAATQAMQFQVPSAPSSRLALRVPGNVELRSGEPVLSRRVDEATNETIFELVPPRHAWSLVFTLNNRLLRSQRVVAARNVLVDEVTQAYERLHAEFSFEVLHGSTDRFQFVVPAEFEITEISSPLLARWVVTEEDGERILDVQMRESITDQVTLSVSATRNRAPDEQWRLPQLRPRDVHHHVVVVGLLVEDRLRSDLYEPTGRIPINTAVLQTALPTSIFVSEPGAPQLRPAMSIKRSPDDLTYISVF